MKKGFSFRKNNNNINSRKAKPISPIKIKNNKYTIRQIEFSLPRPVKEYKRFMTFRKSPADPEPASFLIDFMKKDNNKPLCRPSLYEKFNIKSKNNNHNNLHNIKKNSNKKWSLGTKLNITHEKNLPERQKFKEYYFSPKYNNKDPEKYKNFYLDNEHIGIRIPEIKKVNSSQSFLKLKSDYSVLNETKKENQWVPFSGKKTLNNISSQNYDIINFRPLSAQPFTNYQINNEKTNFKRKGIGEFNDLTRTYSTNFNKEYNKQFNENPKRFHKYKGIFTNMYDLSGRNGNIFLPFDLKSHK